MPASTCCSCRSVPEAGDYIRFAPAKNEAVKEMQVNRILMVPVNRQNPEARDIWVQGVALI